MLICPAGTTMKNRLTDRGVVAVCAYPSGAQVEAVGQKEPQRAGGPAQGAEVMAGLGEIEVAGMKIPVGAIIALILIGYETMFSIIALVTSYFVIGESWAEFRAGQPASAQADIDRKVTVSALNSMAIATGAWIIGKNYGKFSGGRAMRASLSAKPTVD